MRTILLPLFRFPLYIQWYSTETIDKADAFWAFLFFFFFHFYLYFICILFSREISCKHISISSTSFFTLTLFLFVLRWMLNGYDMRFWSCADRGAAVCLPFSLFYFAFQFFEKERYVTFVVCLFFHFRIFVCASIWSFHSIQCWNAFLFLFLFCSFEFR